MFSLITLIVFFAFISVSESFCHGSRTGYRAQFMGRLVADNTVLLGHVFANFSVHNFTQCSGLCKDDCRCRSFNLPMTGQGRCELNDADNRTALMRPLRGSRYHHLEMTEVREGDNTCWEAYENGCCSPNPCHNGSGCTEVADSGKPGFNCSCPSEGYLGQTCERRVKSCMDYLWHNKDSASGYYDIWDDNNVKLRVFCDMQPETLEAWTLVMSYDQSKSVILKDKPFFVDHASNLADAYRLSLDNMERVLEGMKKDGRELEWKATCSYSFTNGRATNDDIVRSYFKTLDIMKFTRNENTLVGYYPFSTETTNQDKSGFGNHATFTGITYEDGPLGDKKGSARMTGAVSSFIRLYDRSGRLDTRYSLTIMMQLYPYDSRTAPLLNWGDGTTLSVHLWQFGGDVFFRSIERSSGASISLTRVAGLGIKKWNYIAVTYDYENLHQSVYVNGTRLMKYNIAKKELMTNGLPITLGMRYGDVSRVYNGRVACLKIFSGALNKQEIEQQTTDWTCPPEPEPLCQRVNYIKIRGKECYDCNVWATQTATEAFTINAHRGDQAHGCNFKSGSTVNNENIFGVYNAKDPTTHACAASDDATTQYWFGGRL